MPNSSGSLRDYCFAVPATGALLNCTGGGSAASSGPVHRVGCGMFENPSLDGVAWEPAPLENMPSAGSLSGSWADTAAASGRILRLVVR